MAAWIAIILPLIPLLVLAARRPHTEKWRRARTRFWLLAVVEGALVAVWIAFINLLGPALIWMSALLAMLIVAAFMGVALATIIREYRAWRELHKGRETVTGVPGIDPTKPWKM